MKELRELLRAIAAFVMAQFRPRSYRVGPHTREADRERRLPRELYDR